MRILKICNFFYNRKYEGWDEEKEREGRSTLVEKSVFAEIKNSKVFRKKREAHIQKKYHPDVL